MPVGGAVHFVSPSAFLDLSLPFGRAKEGGRRDLQQRRLGGLWDSFSPDETQAQYSRHLAWRGKKTTRSKLFARERGWRTASSRVNNTLVWRGENQTRIPRSGVARFSQVASLSSRRCWLAARLEIVRSTSLGGYEGQKGWSIVFDYGDDHHL